jgi:hypothetical protein
MLIIPPNHAGDDRSDCKDEDKDNEDGFFGHRGDGEKLQDAALEWRASRVFCQVPVSVQAGGCVPSSVGSSVSGNPSRNNL